MECPSTTAFWKYWTFRGSYLKPATLIVRRHSSTCCHTNPCQQIKNRRDVICFDNYTQRRVVCSLQHMSYLKHITRVNFYLNNLYLTYRPSTLLLPLNAHMRIELLLHKRARIIYRVWTQLIVMPKLHVVRYDCRNVGQKCWRLTHVALRYS